ncbi:hypothetical protein PIB30_057927 [Stylosanthes scabra]|uniref:Uncharacterized protein n=1 Tax=Stylosanthes scabra TaxID=79078 RepID=A0ABU6SKK9_9FABA|nr:hypothetical protein [Stylosanthes scabra]
MAGVLHKFEFGNPSNDKAPIKETEDLVHDLSNSSYDTSGNQGPKEREWTEVKKKGGKNKVLSQSRIGNEKQAAGNFLRGPQHRPGAVPSASRKLGTRVWNPTSSAPNTRVTQTKSPLPSNSHKRRCPPSLQSSPIDARNNDKQAGASMVSVTGFDAAIDLAKRDSKVVVIREGYAVASTESGSVVTVTASRDEQSVPDMAGNSQGQAKPLVVGQTAGLGKSGQGGLRNQAR